MSLTRTCKSRRPTGEMERNTGRHQHTDLSDTRFCNTCSKSVCQGCYCGHDVPGLVHKVAQ